MKQAILLLLLASSPSFAQTARFPTAIAADKDLTVQKDKAQSTTTVALNASATSFTVVTGSKFIANQIVSIDNEQMLICSVSGSTVSVGYASCPNVDGRGYAGTAAASHINGSLVSANVVSWNHNATKEEVKAVETFLGANGANVVKSFNTRQGVVTPQSGDYTYSQIGGSKQGTTSVPQMAGTNSGTAGAPLCDDANGNATTSGCPAQFSLPTGTQTQTLRIKPNTGNNTTYEFASTVIVNSADYNFAPQTPGGALIVGNTSVTMVPVPLGVNGSDIQHRLYVSGGTGTAESCLITGGTAVSGATTGTAILQCANTHSGAWTVQSVNSGVSEAISSLAGAGGTVWVTGGAKTWHGTAYVPASTTLYVDSAVISSTVMPVVWLQGDGARLVGNYAKILPNASSGAVVQSGVRTGLGALETNHVEITGMQVDGSATTGTVHGISLNSCWNCTVQKSLVTNMSGDGIVVNDATPDATAWGSFFSYIEQNQLFGNGGNGIHLNVSHGGTITMSSLLHNWCHSNLGAGARLSSNGQLFWTRLENNDFEQNASDGLKLVGAVETWIGSGEFEANAGYGINPDLHSNALKISRNVSYYANTLGTVKALDVTSNASMYDESAASGFAQRIQLPGWPVLHHIGPQSQGDYYDVGNNCTPISTTQCNLDDVSKAGWVWSLTNTGGMVLSYASAGANPRTLSNLMQVDSSGSIRLGTLPTTSPGAGSKKLWADPADSYRVKFAN